MMKCVKMRTDARIQKRTEREKERRKVISWRRRKKSSMVIDGFFSPCMCLSCLRQKEKKFFPMQFSHVNFSSVFAQFLMWRVAKSIAQNVSLQPLQPILTSRSPCLYRLYVNCLTSLSSMSARDLTQIFLLSALLKGLVVFLFSTDELFQCNQKHPRAVICQKAAEWMT